MNLKWVLIVTVILTTPSHCCNILSWKNQPELVIPSVCWREITATAVSSTIPINLDRLMIDAWLWSKKSTWQISDAFSLTSVFLHIKNCLETQVSVKNHLQWGSVDSCGTQAFSHGWRSRIIHYQRIIGEGWALILSIASQRRLKYLSWPCKALCVLIPPQCGVFILGQQLSPLPDTAEWHHAEHRTLAMKAWDWGHQHNKKAGAFVSELQSRHILFVKYTSVPFRNQVDKRCYKKPSMEIFFIVCFHMSVG